MEPFHPAPTRKKLPGKHGQHHLIAARRAAAQTSNPFQNRYFLNWHGFRCVASEPRLGRVGGSQRSEAQAWEGGRPWGQFKGRTTDGECASHRTITAADAGT